MSNIIKGITSEDPIAKTQPEVHVPGYGTIPLDMLKRHVQELSKDFNILIQQGAYLKAAYRSEQFFNALMALAKAIKQQENLEESLDEAERPFKAAFNAKPKQKGPGYDKDDYEYTEFVPNLKSKDARQDWAIDRDVKKANAKLSSKSKPASKDTDFYKNYLGNRPIREEDIQEDQAPMFTPEENELNETNSTLKQNALKVMYDAIMIPLRGTRMYPTNEGDFLQMAQISLTQMFGKRYPNLTRQQLVPASQAIAKEMLQFYKKEPNITAYKQSGSEQYGLRESSIMKGLTKD